MSAFSVFATLHWRVSDLQCTILILCRFEIAQKDVMNSQSVMEWYKILFVNRVNEAKLDTDMTIDMLMKKKNFGIVTSSTIDNHDGASLQRRASEFRRVIINEITAAYVKCMPSSGILPSGKTKSDILSMTLRDLWKKEEIRKKEKSKAKNGYEIMPYNEKWRPVGWNIFLSHGMASENCHKDLRLEKSSGPGQPRDVEQSKRSGRKVQRLNEIRDQPILANKLSKSEIEIKEERKLAAEDNNTMSYLSELQAYKLEVNSLKDLINLLKNESDSEDDGQVF